MSTLERAIAIAADAHEGQVRFNGEPYILHPLRVMMSFSGREEQIAAVLHDVVEKSADWPLDRLASEGFSGTILKTVHALTHRENESEEAFLRHAASQPISLAIKRADLEDNIRSAAGHEEKRQEYEARLSRLLVLLPA